MPSWHNVSTETQDAARLVTLAGQHLGIYSTQMSTQMSTHQTLYSTNITRHSICFGLDCGHRYVLNIFHSGLTNRDLPSRPLASDAPHSCLRMCQFSFTHPPIHILVHCTRLRRTKSFVSTIVLNSSYPTG